MDVRTIQVCSNQRWACSVCILIICSDRPLMVNNPFCSFLKNILENSYFFLKKGLFSIFISSSIVCFSHFLTHLYGNFKIKNEFNLYRHLKKTDIDANVCKKKPLLLFKKIISFCLAAAPSKPRGLFCVWSSTRVCLPCLLLYY